MTLLEKAVWAAAFVDEFKRWSSITIPEMVSDPISFDEEPAEMSAKGADRAVMALRRLGDIGHVHVSPDLEAERRAELDIPEEESNSPWSTESHVIRDVAEVKPLLEKAFGRQPLVPDVLYRFLKWLYEVPGFRVANPKIGLAGAHLLAWGDLESLLNDFLGFDKGDDDELWVLRNEIAEKDELNKKLMWALREMVGPVSDMDGTIEDLLNQYDAPDGTPGVRDRDAPCELFQPGTPAGDGSCLGDGHYLCHECEHMTPEDGDEE